MRSYLSYIKINSVTLMRILTNLLRIRVVTVTWHFEAIVEILSVKTRQTRTAATWNIIQVAPASPKLSHAKQPAAKERVVRIRLHLALAAYLYSSPYIASIHLISLQWPTLRSAYNNARMHDHDEYRYFRKRIFR